MDPASAQALHQRWADATPLAEFVEDRAQRDCRKSPLDGAAGDLEALSLMERIAAAFEYQQEIASARKDAQSETQNDLAAGRLVGLGIRSGSRELEEIPFSTWPGSEVDWIHGEMSRGRTRFSDIRVEQPNVTISVTAQRESRQGRPSDVDLILEAIANYAGEDPGLTARPKKRLKAYRDYIAQHENRRVTQGYIEDKTLQKYETIFRQENK